MDLKLVTDTFWPILKYSLLACQLKLIGNSLKMRKLTTSRVPQFEYLCSKTYFYKASLRFETGGSSFYTRG
jgi:hypothetical protein